MSNLRISHGYNSHCWALTSLVLKMNILMYSTVRAARMFLYFLFILALKLMTAIYIKQIYLRPQFMIQPVNIFTFKVPFSGTAVHSPQSEPEQLSVLANPQNGRNNSRLRSDLLRICWHYQWCWHCLCGQYIAYLSANCLSTYSFREAVSLLFWRRVRLGGLHSRTFL